MSEEGSPKYLNILLYMAAGAFITYIWLNKARSKAQSSSEYLLYSQNKELLEQLKLLNDALNRRDELLNEYYKTSQQQYQNIPTVLGSTINTELQQIAIYLDAVNTQLGQIGDQVKQLLETNHKKENYATNTKKELDNNQNNIYQKKDYNINKENENQMNQSKKVSIKTGNDKNKNDKWSVKRGADGRIKSLQSV